MVAEPRPLHGPCIALTPRQLERNWTDGGVLHGQQVLGRLGPPTGAMPCREGEPSLSSRASSEARSSLRGSNPR